MTASDRAFPDDEPSADLGHDEYRQRERDAILSDAETLLLRARDIARRSALWEWTDEGGLSKRTLVLTPAERLGLSLLAIDIAQRHR